MKCLICHEEWPDGRGGVDGVESFFDHLRVNHPDTYEEPERWPDGSLVVYDPTLTPRDFEGTA